jgi:hypothetical protein
MPSGERKRINISLMIPFLVIALVFGLMIWQKYRASREIPPAPQVRQPASMRTVVLFFVTDGSRLVREARQVEPCSDTGACVKEALDALLSGPLGDYDEALPESAALNGVRIEGVTAVVDLNRGFRDDLPAGSSAEMLAVYSIVDTVCSNAPGIERVKLTVEGNAEARLRHLDLAEPLEPDYTLEKTSGPSAADSAGTQTSPATKKGKR